MSKKIITDELITSELEKRGYLEYHDMDENKAWNLLEKHYECEVTDEWRNTSYDFYCYEETTADGYTVYIATNDPDSVCVSEDIHYYENDLAVEIAEAIQEGYSMYIDDLNWQPFMDAVEESYGSMIDDIKEEIENELIEQGYERETDTIAEATT